LKNETLELEFERQNGALIGVRTASGWALLDRPHLGLSFRLLVPLPHRRNNPVYGERQPLSSATIDGDARHAVFVWNSVHSQYGAAPHDIKLTLDVRLDDRQAIFTMAVENHSSDVVENVYCPYLGDIQHPPDTEWFRTFLYQYATSQEWALWPSYKNLRGYYGVDYPTQFAAWSAGVGAPTAPFILLRGPQQGLYVGVAEASSELVAWHTELRPGFSDSLSEAVGDLNVQGHVPDLPTISGKDVATRFAAVHVPYIQPGETRTLTPIALEAFQGGWQAGVDIYKAWRRRWMALPSIPEWAREPHSWLQLHINSPEDELRMRFVDLVQVGEECAHYGVKAIQLVGWNDGGQDQGNPSHDPDPRLGSFAELKAAIARIQALGVKVILFAKFTWADRATDAFRQEYHRLAIKDPYGDYYHYGGYQYQTGTQLLDINTKRLIPMCFLSEKYLAVCEAEFQKTLDLGADGILFDECLHHTPALLCFDSTHGHRHGAPVYANDRKLIQKFALLSGEVNSNFLFAGEACYDWEFEAYHLSYHRSESRQHVPLSRYMLPEVPLMTAVTGFDDRNMINQCLMYRYIISYEPYNFKGRLSDYPLTVAYGQKMDDLRAELRDYFWDGEFRHEVGATVTENGSPHHPYAVFIGRQSGKAGVVVCNYDHHRTIGVSIKLVDGATLARYRLVDDAVWRSAQDGVTLPPRSAAVVLP
jgi:hypothetical protein